MFGGTDNTGEQNAVTRSWRMEDGIVCLPWERLGFRGISGQRMLNLLYGTSPPLRPSPLTITRLGECVAIFWNRGKVLGAICGHPPSLYSQYQTNN